MGAGRQEANGISWEPARPPELVVANDGMSLHSACMVVGSKLGMGGERAQD